MLLPSLFSFYHFSGHTSKQAKLELSKKGVGKLYKTVQKPQDSVKGAEAQLLWFWMRSSCGADTECMHIVFLYP